MSPFVSVIFLNICFIVCTFLSASPFDFGYSGLDVVKLKSHSFVNRWNVVRPSSRRWPSNHPIGGSVGGWSDQSVHGKFLYIWGMGWWQGMSTYLHLISSPAVYSPLWWFSLSREFLRHCAGQQATHCDFLLQAPRCQGFPVNIVVLAR